MNNTEFVDMLSDTLSSSKVMALFVLKDAGYDFNKQVENQDKEIDEKLSQMILNKLTCNVTAPVNAVVEEEVEEVPQHELPQQNITDDIEHIQVETQQAEENIINNEPYQEIPQLNNRETQLMELFGACKTPPAKQKDKVQLVEEILNILIPKSSKGQFKGRIQKDKYKRDHVSLLINESINNEQLAHDLVIWIDEFQVKVNKRNKNVTSVDNLLQIETLQNEETLTDTFDSQVKELSKKLDVEFYILNENKVYIVGKLGRNNNITEELFVKLRKRKSDIYYNLLQNKNLTKVQMYGFGDDDLNFASKLLDNNIDVQLVKGYKADGMSFEAILFNSKDNIKHYYQSVDEEIVIQGVHSKYNKSCACTEKQLALFKDLGGEIIINNSNFFRVALTFTISQVSTAIELLKSGYSVVLQDFNLRQ